MRLSELFKDVDHRLVGDDIEIADIAYDSRRVRSGTLFAAISGLRFDGHEFVSDAIEHGATAVLVERELPGLDVPQIVVRNTREVLGTAAAAFYGHPARKMRIIGVTGTNGKTTTTYMIKSILEEAGKKVGIIGTIETLVGDRSIESDRTTPESLDLQRILAEMVAAQTDYVVMEVSSHALELHRTAGITFHAGVFTNLSQDHLDFHKTLDEYCRSKAKLFRNLADFAVVNFDDPRGLVMAAGSTRPVYSYGVEQTVQIRGTHITVGSKGVSYSMETPWGSVDLELYMTGRFNVYNSLAAAAVCLGEGVELETVKRGLENLRGVPGRFEVVDEGQPFGVIVDYAHTPDGLENILRTARSMTEGRVIVVFGAGGDRDRSKRPLMGDVAARLADEIIITSDNPRSEEPQDICSAILEGVLSVNRGSHYTIEVDRRSAIRAALTRAKPQDIVIIAGKGHETYQEVQGVRRHFDDREEARKALKELDR